MSNAPFSNNIPTNNPNQTTLNIFFIQDNKNQKSSSNNSNPNQGQTNSNNQLSSGLATFKAPSTPSSVNPFISNIASNNAMRTNDNKKPEDNNPFSSFLNNKGSTILNQNNNNNNNKIGTSLNVSNNNNNSEQNKISSIFNSNNNNTSNNNTNNITNSININNKTNNNNTNNINNNNSSNNAFDFFNVKNIQKNNESHIKNVNTNNNKEEKKESMNIFMAQSNNILNKLNNDKNNTEAKKDNDTHLNIDTSSNKNNNNNIIGNLLNNQNENESDKEKEEKAKADEFINNLFVEDKLFSTDKQLMEYEKNQLSYKLNDDIVNEFKNMLFSQKEKFSKFISNTRILEERIKQNNILLKKNAHDSFENQIKYEQVSQKFKSLYQNSINLRHNLSLKEKTMIDAVNYVMNNNNRKNNSNINFSSLNKSNFDENIPCFKDVKETCQKIKQIDNDLMLISNSIIKNEKNIINKNKDLYEIYKDKNKYNDESYSNNKIKNEFSGVWLERNSENKVYIDQNIMNSLLSDCYNGLNNLKYAQDEFEFKYTQLKNRLIVYTPYEK